MENEIRVHLTQEVFVAGSIPRKTYNPRRKRNLESTVAEYLEDPGKALTIHGPSKCGKTSLVRHVLDPLTQVRIEGQEIASVEDLWKILGSQLDIAAKTSRSRETGGGDDFSLGAKIGAGGTGAELQSKELRTWRSQSSVEIPRSIPSEVGSALQRRIDLVIVIDDYHYIPSRTKAQIARAIKSLILMCPVVLIAVPSGAFDLLREESDMELRVWSLEVPRWEQDELSQIAADGFSLLNLLDPGDTVAKSLSRASFGSPFLMQQLLHMLVKTENGISETRRTPTQVDLPTSVEKFMTKLADRTEPAIFKSLRTGPPTRGTDRQTHHLLGGVTADIYEVTWIALGRLLRESQESKTPRMHFTRREILDKANGISRDGVSSPNVSNVLTQCSSIAFSKRGDSDPAIRVMGDTLWIESSPLAFYVVHGSWPPVPLAEG